MINNDRIVPITTVDLLTMYGLILKSSMSPKLEKLSAVDAIGDFNVTSGTTEFIADEPVRKCNFGADVATTVYFVPSYDYEGFSYNGAAVATADVEADGCTLYKAVRELDSTSITVSKVGF